MLYKTMCVDFGDGWHGIVFLPLKQQILRYSAGFSSS